MRNEKRLLHFYFGSLSEEDRLELERDLLTDPELLTDYLDLKRELEASPLVQTRPSVSLWERLRPKTERQRRLYLSLSLGAAIAAGLALALLVQSRKEPTEFLQPPVTKVLFDSSAELSPSSGVL